MSNETHTPEFRYFADGYGVFWKMPKTGKGWLFNKYGPDHGKEKDSICSLTDLFAGEIPEITAAEYEAAKNK